jgi:predicted dehydrogenase
MADKLGVGVIGVGTFGGLHAQVYSQLEMCNLVAVADVNPVRLESISAELGVDGYTDYRELLAREEIDAVSICTTDELHVEPAIAAADAAKHVLIEKPLALTPEDCDKIIQAADAAGIKLMVGHILRFDPRYRAVCQEVQSGKIGQPIHLYARRNNAYQSAERLAAHTSVLFFLGVHDLDCLNWCLGCVPETVYAQAASVILGHTPDAVHAVLRFPGGAIASLEVSWVLPEGHPRGLDAQFDVVGTAGAVYVNGTGDTVSVVRDRLTHPALYYAPELLGERVGILRDEISHFCRCVRDNRQPLVSGLDGKAAVQVACAIQESYRSGRVIEVQS